MSVIGLDIGYKWHPTVRMIPDNGPEETLDLIAEFTDQGGPDVDLRYAQVEDRGDDLNRSLRHVQFGLRPEVRLTFDIATMTHHATLAKIVNRINRDDWVVKLALDYYLTERQVVINRRPPSPRKFRGKTLVGSQFRLDLLCVDVIDEIAAIRADPGGIREWLENGGFEFWTAGAPDKWDETETGGTINQETTEVRTGASAVEIARTSASTLIVTAQDANTFPLPGDWALIEMYAKASSVITDGLTFRVQRTSPTRYVNEDGVTWTGPGIMLIKRDLTTSFQLFSFRFQISPDFVAGDAYKLGLSSDTITGVGESVYIDDVRVISPVLPPGVATW